MTGWIFKTEPDTYSIADLAREKRCRWDGVRNYTARNFLRDTVAVGDAVAIWHSSCPQPGVVGLAKVVKAGYPDPTAFDPGHGAFDPASKPEQPRWYSVDLAFVRALPAVLPIGQLRADPAFKDLLFFKQNRLSLCPVQSGAWARLGRLAGWAP